MCTDCRSIIEDMILDFMLQTGVGLEVAIVITRDVVVQRALREPEEPLGKAIDLSASVKVVADELRTMDPHLYAAILKRRLQKLRAMAGLS